MCRTRRIMLGIVLLGATGPLLAAAAPRRRVATARLDAELAAIVRDPGNAELRYLLGAELAQRREYTEAVASRLQMLAPKVVLMGGLFHRDSLYTHSFRRRLKKNLPDARVATAERSAELGAAWLAAAIGDDVTFQAKLSPSEIDDLAVAITEQRNPRSENLEKMSTRELVELFVDEEKFVQDALRGAIGALTHATEIATESLRNGGRMFYVGAGSSGRIGFLDASELPPTFGVSPDLVQGVIAGGATAIYRSVEGAEDEESTGALAMNERGINNRDVVIGITASGRTPGGPRPGGGTRRGSRCPVRGAW